MLKMSLESIAASLDEERLAQITPQEAHEQLDQADEMAQAVSVAQEHLALLTSAYMSMSKAKSISPLAMEMYSLLERQAQTVTGVIPVSYAMESSSDEGVLARIGAFIRSIYHAIVAAAGRVRKFVRHLVDLMMGRSTISVKVNASITKRSAILLNKEAAKRLAELPKEKLTTPTLARFEHRLYEFDVVMYNLEEAGNRFSSVNPGAIKAIVRGVETAVGRFITSMTGDEARAAMADIFNQMGISTRMLTRYAAGEPGGGKDWEYGFTIRLPIPDDSINVDIKPLVAGRDKAVVQYPGEDFARVVMSHSKANPVELVTNSTLTLGTEYSKEGTYEAPTSEELQKYADRLFAVMNKQFAKSTALEYIDAIDQNVGALEKTVKALDPASTDHIDTESMLSMIRLLGDYVVNLSQHSLILARYSAQIQTQSQFIQKTINDVMGERVQRLEDAAKKDQEIEEKKAEKVEVKS